MKIEKTITTPAIPAKTTVRSITLCDDCKKEITAYVSKCEECGAELCYKCARSHPEDVGGDREDSICSSCLETFQLYKEDLDALEAQIDDLKESRNNLCRYKRTKLNETNKT
jgi:hypothetical protein